MIISYTLSEKQLLRSEYCIRRSLGGVNMAKKAILSEKLEDNKAAAEWGIRQAKLIKKSEDITRRLAEKYIPIILSRNERNN